MSARQKASGVFCLFCFLCPGFLFSLEDVSLVPREIYIGDEALVSYSDSGSFASRFSDGAYEISASDLPDSDAVSVKAVRCRKADGKLFVEIRFVPWTPGDLEFPAINLGGALLPVPAVTVSSLLEKSPGIPPFPARPPKLYPGTVWMLYAAAAAALTTALAAYLLFGKALPRFARSSGARRRARNKRQTLRGLRALERKIRTQPRVLWFAAAARLFRRFLAVQSGCSESAFDSLSTPEIRLRTGGDDDPWFSNAASILSETDLRRFGNPEEDYRADTVESMIRSVREKEVSDV